MNQPLRRGSLLSPLPDGLCEEQIETLLESGRFRLERILSQGQVSPEGFWFDQDTDEWVALLRGAAAIEIEGRDLPLRLQPGDWVLLPKGLRHRVAYTAEAEVTVWLALHADLLLEPPTPEKTRSLCETPETPQ